MIQTALPLSLKLSTTSKNFLHHVDKPDDDAHARALEGLPHYWKLSWGWTDTILADCGKHKLLVRVDWLEDPAQKIFTSCPYKESGLCNE